MKASKFTLSTLAAAGALLAVMAATPATRAAAPAPAAQGPGATPPHMQWWRDARFGMFIHWGPISLKGTDISWSRDPNPGGPNPGGVPAAEYDNLYKRFNPTKFNAPAIVALAKAAGMKYIVLVCKHHDGFCEFDSSLTDYKITSPLSPYHKDIVRQMADACHAAGMHFCVYYSPPDLHNPDYMVNQTPPGHSDLPLKDPAARARYNRYFHGQVHELMTHYGKVDLVWFDKMDSVHSPAPFLDADGLLAEMRAVNPNVIINNRIGLPGDFQTPEQNVGGYNDQRPWESCITMGMGQWSYKPGETYKSASRLIRTLAQCVGGDGNMLLNIGPQPDGAVDPTQADRLRSIAAWMKKNGEAVTGTRGGPYLPTTRYVSTRRGDMVYVHVLHWSGDQLLLPALPRHVLTSRLLGGGPVHMTQGASSVTLQVPAASQDASDTVIALHLDGSAMTLATILAATTAKVTASASAVYGNAPEFGAARAFDDDEDSRWASPSGTRQAWLQADYASPQKVCGVTVEEAYAFRVQKFQIQGRLGSGDWVTLAEGTHLGPEYHTSFAPVSVTSVRLNILDATDAPTISSMLLDTLPH